MKRMLVVLRVASILVMLGCGTHFEQRDAAAPLRTYFPRANSAFFFRYHQPYRFSAALDFAHAKAHDDLQLTSLDQAYYYDGAAESSYLDAVYKPPHTQPDMMMYGSYTGRAAWKLYRAIDWTNAHQELTCDILSDADIPWDRKGEWIARAVAAYLTRDPEAARSPAVVELTLRRAGVLLKPYFGIFRTYYPRTNSFFTMAHWWRTAIVESMMIGGNGADQDAAVRQTHRETFLQVISDRPERTLLAREAMPRFARLSPDSANIIDNLHLLHGIAYDILAYEGWTIEQKRAELYRVLRAVGFHAGDEAYARKFSEPHPEMDPRRYPSWMKSPEGAMTATIEDCFREMWPRISPDGSGEVPAAVMDQVRKKLAPGLQPGEIPGSLLDAIRELVPRLRVDSRELEPGAPPVKMIEATAAWERKAHAIPDVTPIAMDREPAPPSGP